MFTFSSQRIQGDDGICQLSLNDHVTSVHLKGVMGLSVIYPLPWVKPLTCPEGGHHQDLGQEQHAASSSQER